MTNDTHPRVQPSNLPIMQQDFPTEGLHRVGAFEEVLKYDVKVSNYVLARVGAEWDNTSGIDDVCKLSMLTMRMLKERRDLLMMPYGCKSTEKQDLIILPID